MTPTVLGRQIRLMEVSMERTIPTNAARYWLESVDSITLIDALVMVGGRKLPPRWLMKDKSKVLVQNLLSISPVTGTMPQLLHTNVPVLIQEILLSSLLKMWMILSVQSPSLLQLQPYLVNNKDVNRISIVNEVRESVLVLASTTKNI
jgi:hypothetical protein